VIICHLEKSQSAHTGSIHAGNYHGDTGVSVQIADDIMED